VSSVTKPNPENCKNCSSKCAYDCTQLQYTIQHRTVLIIPDSNLQTTIIAQVLSIGGEGGVLRWQFPLCDMLWTLCNFDYFRASRHCRWSDRHTADPVHCEHKTLLLDIFTSVGNYQHFWPLFHRACAETAISRASGQNSDTAIRLSDPDVPKESINTFKIRLKTFLFDSA